MKKSKRLKQGIFGLLTVLLTVPFIQQSTSLLEIDALNGAFVPKEYTPVSVESWLSGEFQNQTDLYLNEQFGFRNALVRLHNQINYTLFESNNLSGTVVGKDKVLFQRPYIDSYYGNDFVGEEKVLEMVRKTKRVQDTLKTLGVPFIPVIAPGKAWFYPEHIPKHLQQKKGTTNYDRYRHNFHSYGLEFLDLQDWLLNVKDTASFAIFPQYGIHWSNYVGILVQDTLLKSIDKQTPFTTPKLRLKRPKKSFDFDEKEYDIMTAMNLWTYPQSDIETYRCSYESIYPEGSKKINLLTIGDSFYNQFCTEFEDAFCNKSAYWYYNRTIITDIENYPTRVEFADLKKEILKMDALVLLITEGNLKDYAFGFIDKLYSIFFENKSFTLDKNAIVNLYENEIRSSDAKMDYMRKKAISEGVPLDTIIKKDAVWLYENQYLPSLQ